MQIKDFKLFDKDLYYNPKSNIDIGKYILTSKDIALMKPDIYTYLYSDVLDSLYSDEHDKINASCFSVLNKLGKSIPNAPAELIQYIYLLNEQTNDFQLYPTFYLQGILDIIQYYTINHEGFVKSKYTIKSLINELLDCEVTLLDEINLKGTDGKLVEMYVKNVGVGIFDKSFVSKFPSRKAILELELKDNELKVGNNIMLQVNKSRNSLLDWRRG